MNEMPPIEDNSNGMWRRFEFIEFDRTFTPDEDFSLKDMSLTVSGQRSILF